MKKSIVIIFLALAVNACAPKIYYQVYEARSINALEDGQNLKFDDDNITVLYNLWAETGDISYFIYNKTDDYIYLDMEMCHFIKNKMAYDYYNMESTSHTSYTGYSNSIYISPASSWSSPLVVRTENNIIASKTQVEKKIVVIPPKSFKSVEGYNINSKVYKTCDFKGKPKRFESVQFDRNETPLVFSNLISYGFNTSLNDQRVVPADFYIWKITNYKKKYFVKSVYPVECGKKMNVKVDSLLHYSPRRFYIKYE